VILKAMKENKLNAVDCGSNLTIIEGGLVAKHSGTAGKNKIVFFYVLNYYL
jgi:hypothetical protein